MVLTVLKKWHLGESMSQYKIKINIILALVIGFIFGGVGQYFWEVVCRPADLKESVC